MYCKGIIKEIKDRKKKLKKGSESENTKERKKECQQSDKVIVLCTHLESTEAKPLLREALTSS